VSSSSRTQPVINAVTSAGSRFRTGGGGAHQLLAGPPEELAVRILAGPPEELAVRIVDIGDLAAGKEATDQHRSVFGDCPVQRFILS
jgi:hypothetical protein